MRRRYWKGCRRSYSTKRPRERFSTLHHGVGVWTYDAKAKKFRVHWFDDWGGVARGTATHDSKTGTWKMRYKSKSAMGNSVGEGTFAMTDDDTMEWTWSEWDGLKMFKYMEMTGTSKRQK